MNRKIIAGLLLAMTLLTGLAYAATDAEMVALKTVNAEIAAVLAGRSEYAKNLGRTSDFAKDLVKLLALYRVPAIPKTLKFNGRPAKILVPLVLDANKVGGFFQLSPDGKQIISYLIWDNKLKPLFVIDRNKWEAADDAGQLAELAELMPLSEGHSAGVPVEKSDLTELFLIDYISQLPSKTQEELAAYTSTVGLKSQLGRRTGSSKCLSYSASLASDWWNIAQGNQLGSYDSFVNGAREYGMNPRIVESLYFSFPKCPYSFVKETGRDRITGEKVPYSPKHYAWIMSAVKLPTTIQDPLKSENTWKVPANGFGMDLPFCNSFTHSKGNVDKIREDLKRYGIIYAQHTSRLFNNKVSVTLQGVHSINIVGTAKLKGEPVVIYYETFGKNSRDYLEDSFYGPALRAFPVKFFYQGIMFPHRIIADVKVKDNFAAIVFKTAEGKAITPERLKIWVNGKMVETQPTARLNVPLGTGNSSLRIAYSRKYFFTPEEPNGYERNFLISNDKIIELGHYEAVVKTLAERRGGLFTKVFGKDDSYTDYLAAHEESTRADLLKQMNTIRANKGFIGVIAAEVSKSNVLKGSDFGKAVAGMVKFNQINK